MCSGASGGQKRALASMKPELHMVVRGHLTTEEALNKQALWSLAEEMAQK